MILAVACSQYFEEILIRADTCGLGVIESLWDQFPADCHEGFWVLDTRCLR